MNHGQCGTGCHKINHLHHLCGKGMKQKKINVSDKDTVTENSRWVIITHNDTPSKRHMTNDTNKDSYSKWSGEVLDK